LAANLGLLGYFKYANFLLAIVGAPPIDAPTLPLGISFFTFTQIAYLVDAYRQPEQRVNPVDYSLFVTYFPHLIAGPVLYHREMIPQFVRGPFAQSIDQRVAIGLSIFVLGLCKKLLLADSVAPYADAIFGHAADVTLTMTEAWVGAIAYGLQIYFDFSAYSDMAVGLSYMLGFRLPLNFYSPYQATSIVDFWRRWHMTLSRFLRDYLYIPLGGNRKGPLRRYTNLMLTMLIGGLWHGAGWTFVIWGGLHGLYLTINHVWNSYSPFSLPTWVGRVLTLAAVMVAWVFFRAESFQSASAIVWAMAGGNGIPVPSSVAGMLAAAGISIPANVGLFPHGALDGKGLVMIAALAGVALFAPNVMQLFSAFQPTIEQPKVPVRLSWRPAPAVAVGIGVMFAAAITMLAGESPFLYFRF